MKKLFLALAISLMASYAALAQPIFVIDNFTDYMKPVTAPAIDDSPNGWTIQQTSAGQTYTETGISGVVGGSRKTILYGSDTIPNIANESKVIVSPYNAFSVSNGIKSYNTLDLVYDANGAGLNLDASSGTKFWANIYFDHLGNQKASKLSLTIVDGNANTSTVTKSWLNYTIPNPNPQDYVFLFSDFTGIDFSNIYSITLSYGSDYGNDYEIYGIYSDIVPEPSSIAALLGGLGGLVALKRRKS